MKNLVKSAILPIIAFLFTTAFVSAISGPSVTIQPNTCGAAVSWSTIPQTSPWEDVQYQVKLDGQLVYTGHSISRTFTNLSFGNHCWEVRGKIREDLV